MFEPIDEILNNPDDIKALKALFGGQTALMSIGRIV